ncbi:MAG TPA: acyl-ACP thioesterase domain-containing protein [Thermoanaerobaculaceae bacterium]|nr:acyl-ACP thioesterase domain-containing protein [Thermoanaerobaculaceae bacterium]
MDQAPPEWTESFRVRAYEVDVSGRASVATVCNWLQETAGNHVTALGWAVDDLAPRGLTWVLSRLHLRLHRLPGWRDDVRIVTWHAGVLRLYGVREFRLTEAQGRELGTATSAWLLIDLESRRPTRPLEALPVLDHRAAARILVDPFDKIPGPAGAERETVLVARLADLDMNRHANNVSVIGWALDALPDEVVLGSSPAELEIEFRAEAVRGDHIIVQVQRISGEPATFLHRLLRESDGREIARARTLWRSG